MIQPIVPASLMAFSRSVMLPWATGPSAESAVDEVGGAADIVSTATVVSPDPTVNEVKIT